MEDILMVDTPQVVFTDHDGNTYNIFTNDLNIDLFYDGLTIEHKSGHVGLTTDKIREFRTVTCSCTMTGTALNTLQGQLMDATKTYDGTDPKIAVVYDGSSSWTILVAVMHVNYKPIANNLWQVTFTFTERST